RSGAGDFLKSVSEPEYIQTGIRSPHYVDGEGWAKPPDRPVSQIQDGTYAYRFAGTGLREGRREPTAILKPHGESRTTGIVGTDSSRIASDSGRSPGIGDPQRSRGIHIRRDCGYFESAVGDSEVQD